MKYIILTLLILTSYNSLCWTTSDLPNPNLDNSFVSNPDMLLDKNTVNRLNSLIRNYEEKTNTQIAIIVVETIGSEVPKQFAVDIFNKWGVGQKDVDNGILILAVMDQRRFEIEVGYGLEGSFPDTAAARIVHDILIPKMRESGINDSIYYGLEGIINSLDSGGSGAVNGVNPSEIANLLPFAFMSMFFLIGIVVPIFIFSRFIILFKSLAHNSIVESFVAQNSKFSSKETNKVELLEKQLHSFREHFSADIMANQKTYKSSKPFRVDPIMMLFLFTFVGGVIVCFASIMFFDFILGLILSSILILNIGFGAYLKFKDVKRNKIIDYALSKDKYPFSVLENLFFFPVVVLILVSKRMLSRQLHILEVRMKEKGFEFISESDEDAHLSKIQKFEEKIKSREHDVFKDPKTGNVEVVSREIPFSSYSECESCHAKSRKLISSKTLTSATRISSGTGKKTFLCEYCKHEDYEIYIIPKIQKSSSRSSFGGSSSSSRSGSSFGGGRSGGGGAGGSW